MLSTDILDLKLIVFILSLATAYGWIVDKSGHRIGQKCH